jgi:nucleoid DNA-binding protein
MNKKYSKKDIINYLESEKVGLSYIEAKEIMQNFLDIIIEETKKDKKIKFYGFGSFELVARASKSARNFKTNEVLETPPYQTIKFKTKNDYKNLSSSK